MWETFIGNFSRIYVPWYYLKVTKQRIPRVVLVCIPIFFCFCMGWTVFYAFNINPAYVFDPCCHSLFRLASFNMEYSFFLFSWIFFGNCSWILLRVPCLGFAHGLFHASCMTKILQQWVEGDPFDRSALLCDVPVQFFRLNLKGQALLHRSHQSMWRSFLDVHLYIPLIKKKTFSRYCFSLVPLHWMFVTLSSNVLCALCG